ncbi:MAG: efflux RND transporter permease subunit, partial [Acidimicrobiia bacterium]
IYEDRGPNFISRENVQRKIVVMCNVAGRDMRGVVDDTRAAIALSVDMPRGYYVEFGGQFESAEATNRRLSVLGLLVIAGMGFLLHLVFGSVRDTLLIMVNLPLALIGGVVGVWVSGGVLSVASLIGFISVFGIAARNGIMMVAHIRHLQQVEGVLDFREAVRQGAMERLAPILMTALAAGLALIPLALRAGEPGTEILTPMAIVILFGLLSSTTLNMVVVPALFVRFGRPAKAVTAMDADHEAHPEAHDIPA